MVKVLKIDEPRRTGLAVHDQLTGRDRKLKPSRSGTARIYAEDTGPPLNTGLVGMTGKHDGNARTAGIDVHLRQIMNDIQAGRANCQQFKFRQFARPGTAVIVATHGRDGRDARRVPQPPRVRSRCHHNE